MDNLSVAARSKVFLSHSSSDAALARRLALDLESANVDVWLDQWNLRVGEQIYEGVKRGVEEADFVIVLLTGASVASGWVDREWRLKFDEEARTGRVSVVPVRGDICEIPDFLAQRSHADISGGSYLLGFRHLLEILRHHSKGAEIWIPESRGVEKREFSQHMMPVVTPITLEVGCGLVPPFEADSEGSNRFLDELAPSMRDALQAEFGFPFPGIRVRGNESDMPPNAALILIDEVPEILFEVDLDDVLVDGTIEGLASLGIDAELRNDPAAGRARARIAAADRAAAIDAGLATWDAAEYLCLALQAVIRRMAALFLDIDVTRRLVDAVESTAPELVAETIPKVVSWIELTDVLMRLVEEGINIGDMKRILEAISHYESTPHDTVMLAEHVRHALSRQITAKYVSSRGPLKVLLLDHEIEASITGAIQRTSVGPYLSLEPRITREILAAIREKVKSLGPLATGVPILTVSEIRRYIRKLVQLEFPMLDVLSRQDLEADTQIEPIASISLFHPSTGSLPADGGLSS